MNLPANAGSGGVIDRIVSLTGSMPKALARVARYISLYPERVVTFSIVELGAATQSGQATIIRLCRLLGYSGFRDIKLALAQDMASERLLLAKTEASTAIVDIDKLNLSIQSSIQQTAQMLATCDLGAISERIARSSRIIVFGEGVSAFCASMVSHRLLRMGYPAFHIEAIRLAELTARSLPADGLAIAVSRSGLNAASMEFIEAAHAAGADSMVITGRSDGPLARVAHQVLPFHQPAPLPLEGSMRYIAPFVVALETLAGNLMLTHPAPDGDFVG